MISPEIRLAAYHLLWVWAQYGSVYKDPATDQQYFEHQCMSAGEDATDWLASLGLGRDQGTTFEPNDIAIALMDCEILDDQLCNYGGAGNWDESILGPKPPLNYPDDEIF